jgi:hypothetical protein
VPAGGFQPTNSAHGVHRGGNAQGAGFGDRLAQQVDLRTGAIMWQLGGKHSTFAIKAAPGQKLDTAGEIFAFQHDPEALGRNLYTVFDDESDGQSTL